jgi:HEAT repeat protein
MSSSRAFFAILCLLALPLFANAEKPTDSRLTKNDESSSTKKSSETESDEDGPKSWGGKTLEDWKKDLSHPDPSVRAHAISVLPGFGRRGARVVEPLTHRLADNDNSCRVKTAIALRMMYIPDNQRATVIKALGRCMVSQNSQAVVRYEAMFTLTLRFCPLVGDERAIIPELAGNIGSAATFELRQMSILALIMAGVDEKNGPDPRITNALLLRTNPYNEPAEQVRLEAIQALGALGRPHDPKLLTTVINTLRMRHNFGSSNKVIRMWSHVALMALEDKIYEKELSAIADNLKDKEATVRAQALTALGALQDKAHAYVGQICTMLTREKDPDVLSAAARALGHMGNKGERVINALINMTEKEDRKDVGIVLAACEALAKLSGYDPAALQAMEKVKSRKSLDKYQKVLVENYIDELKHPKKKPLKDPPKSPENGVGRAPARGTR